MSDQTFEQYANENDIKLSILSRPIAPFDQKQMLSQYRQKDPHYTDLWRVRVYKCELGGRIETDFSKGIGLREGRKLSPNGIPIGKKIRFPQVWNNLTYDTIQNMLACKPIDPTVGEILECLFMDASGAEQSFYDWARDLGYDNDSRKAEQIYNTCTDINRKLRSMLTFEDLYSLEQS